MVMEISFLRLPFKIAIDTREGAPWSFQRMRLNNSSGKKLEVLVETEKKTLASGDYSIVGHENEVAIERKSPEDLVQSLTTNRARFERELIRLEQFDASFVLVEAPFQRVLQTMATESRAKPLSVYRSVLAFALDYKTKWHFAASRRAAEEDCLWLLKRWFEGRE